MAGGWRAPLRADPIPWLLEPENAAVRYSTMRCLLARPADDPEVLACQAAIPLRAQEQQPMMQGVYS